MKCARCNRDKGYLIRDTFEGPWYCIPDCAIPLTPTDMEAMSVMVVVAKRCCGVSGLVPEQVQVEGGFALWFSGIAL